MRAAAAALGEPVQDVVDDPVALLLAEQDVAGEPGLLRIVGEQVAQQQRRALDVAAGLLEEREQFRDLGGRGGTAPREPNRLPPASN